MILGININRLNAVVLRHLYNYRHHLDRLTDSFYWPAMDLIIWGLTSQYIQRGNEFGDIVIILLSGLVFWQVVWRGQYEIATNFLEELWSQNLVNLFSTPLKLREWLGGLLFLGFFKMLITVGFSFLLTWLFYQINLLNFGILLVPFVASLLMVGWWVGLVVASFLVLMGRQIQTIAWAGVYLLAPFSAIYYPVDSLPIWAQKIAAILPSSYIFEGMREVLMTGRLSGDKLVISFGLNIFYLLLAVLFFKYCFKKSLNKGLARLEY